MYYIYIYNFANNYKINQTIKLIMPTLSQLSQKTKGRQKKLHKDSTKALENAPRKRGVAIKVYTTSPKKPNSAVRKVAKVKLCTGRKL